MPASDPRLLLLHPGDNVLVLRAPIAAGEPFLVEGVEVRLATGLGMGHKVARQAIAAGAKVVKYGAPIGSASVEVAAGAHVHLHNLRSDYTPTHSLAEAQAAHAARRSTAP